MPKSEISKKNNKPPTIFCPIRLAKPLSGKVVGGKGQVLTFVLVFGGIFLLILSSALGFILLQHRYNLRNVSKYQALAIAEAGVNYYRWYLAHRPGDLSDPGGPEHEYFDPQGKAIGKFSLEISGEKQCDAITKIVITSTGWTYDFPSLKRKVKVQYAQPSITEFSTITNSDVWVGSDVEIKGRYHNNGGIRMDGENDSLMASAKESWTCTSSFGCTTCQSPCWPEGSLCKCPGIFGAGEGQEKGLWKYPVEPIDFQGIATDLNQMKTKAKSFGVYLGPSGAQGYQVIFKDNGTFDVYKITQLTPVWGYSLEEEWHWDYHKISKKTFIGNYSIPSSCGLVFVEDKLWVEGEVKGKVTIVSADLINPNNDTDVVLNWNLTYTKKDGSDGILVIGERNVLIPLYSPDTMELDGIFLAQKGRFSRNHYSSSYAPWHIREKLEILGSIISNGRIGTQWSYSDGTLASGYKKREYTYDWLQVFNPPPLTPAADDEYQFIKWEEVQ
jgi:hypothetical protein